MSRKTAEPHRIVHISAARRLGCTAEPKTEPPCEVVPLMASEVPENSRALLVEADIRADMNAGDPMGWALRKVNYVISAARGAFKEPEHLESVVSYAIEAVRDYGEPQGAELLRKASCLYGSSPRVRAALSEAAARIGGPGDFDIIISCLKSDLPSPSAHLRALSDFADRHPEQSRLILGDLRMINDPDEAVLEAINSFSRRE